MSICKIFHRSATIVKLFKNRVEKAAVDTTCIHQHLFLQGNLRRKTVNTERL